MEVEPTGQRGRIRPPEVAKTGRHIVSPPSGRYFVTSPFSGVL